MTKNRFFQIDPKCFQGTCTTHFGCPEYDFDHITVQKLKIDTQNLKPKSQIPDFRDLPREVPWVQKSAKNRFFQIDSKCTQETWGTKFGCSGYDFDQILIQKRQMRYPIPKIRMQLAIRKVLSSHANSRTMNIYVGKT